MNRETLPAVHRLYAQCVHCLLNKQLLAGPKEADDAIRTQYAQQVLRLVASVPPTTSAPELLCEIQRLQDRCFPGWRRDYESEKRHFNNVMLAQEDWMSSQINAAPDPFLRAIQLAMAGNYIDFSAVDNVEEATLRRLLSEAGSTPLDSALLEQFRQELRTAGKIVLLTDNCGEIVADKLLLRQISNLAPDALLIAMVKGGPAENDATAEDARQTGLDEVCTVMDTGAAIPGTPLRRISEPALEAILSADVILSKGQANFETLRGVGLNIYYMFLCKCAFFAGRFGVPRLTGMFLNDRALPEAVRRR